MKQTDTQIQIKISSSDKEKILTRMKGAGVTNLSAYIRKMAIDGYIIMLDISDFKDALQQLSDYGKALGVVIDRCRTEGNIEPDDVDNLQEHQDRIWKTMQQILVRLSQIS